MSLFLRPDDEYVREINVMEGYMTQLAEYLHIQTGKPIDVVKKWLKKEFETEEGRFKFTAPIADINVRDPETGDRKATRISVAKLLAMAAKNEIITSPSLTFYTPAKKKRSLLSVFIDENIAKRARVKKEMFVAQANGEEVKAQNKKNEQNSFKTLNNATSGAHSSPYTLLFNKSTHSSLTSTCRSATSYGNANNEKLLAGSRHYWMPGIVINNILSTIALTDFDAFQGCVDEYNLHYPTVEETMACIEYSTHLFWTNIAAMEHIEDFVSKLSPIQRAAFVYIGDLFHLRKYNPEVVRGWIGAMIEMTDERIDPEEIENVEKTTDGDLTALVALLRADLVGPRNLRKVKEQDPEDYRILMSTCRKVREACIEYSTLIREIMTTKNVPSSIARLPDTIRRVSLVSDTDSTMATAQRWSEWFCGKMTGQVADNVADTMIYIATQNIAHMMARMSTQMGVEKQYLHRYSMKNEFKFSAFALTNKAKHYFSLITSQEGTLFEDPELEVKGVALRTSNIPPIIMNEFRNTITTLSRHVMNGEDIEIVPLLERVGDIEHNIIRSVHNGDYQYLKTGQIKDKTAYSKPESSSFVYWEWWESTFGPKYGSAGTPSYGVVKISVDLGNKTLIKRWIDNMEDRELAGRIQEWHLRNPKRKFTQLLLPETVIATNGIPKEILAIADYRRIIFASVEPYYHVLECFKLMMIDKNRTRMVSDFYGEPIENELTQGVT